ncbi:unnamed protein product [Protopolystoma xenopodis]|uniref:Defective in cullin neddylation protein n=1 Tax=Protopolystoma xenopodis TaxID=117903 RepID=A0A448WM97_9PLAT|nr:unnamed protein product [Protopolystoma xenopodis]
MNSSQRDKVKKFQSITHSNEKVAINCLQNYNWKIEQAVDFYYSQNQANSNPQVNETKIALLFDKYKDPKYFDLILATGMERFLVHDLQLPLDGITCLMLAWKFSAKTQGEFTRTEFLNGMRELGMNK